MRERTVYKGFANPLSERAREEALKRAENRAAHLGYSVAAVTFVGCIIAGIVLSLMGSSYGNVGWFYGGAIGGMMTGITSGLVYYTITAWRNL